MAKELTFEEFSDKLKNMNERCGSCKYLTREGEASMCRKHNVPRSNKSPKCVDWRYFA